MLTKKYVEQILRDTAYTRVSGSEGEIRAAKYLIERCEEIGVAAYTEEFTVQMADVKDAHLLADGMEIPCKAFKNCGSGEVEAEFCYLPNVDPVSLMCVKGKIVLVDTGMGHFLYQDLYEAGAAGFITYTGNVNYRDDDIDFKELRAYVSLGKKIPGVNVNAKQAVRLVEMQPKKVRLIVDQIEYEGPSRNVIAEIPGTSDEWIVLTAHYDSTPLSIGAYDNMTGCIGLLGIMKEMKAKAPCRYGLRFIFCSSEERGLLGSKAYTAAHEQELRKVALNINLDMIGSIMGKFLACCSAEQKLPDYLSYMAAEMGWGIKAYIGVYASDSTPFADKGVPSLSFARLAGNDVAPIHNRYDTRKVLSADQLIRDTAFILAFTERMANAVKCPVSREMPEKVLKDLDEYLARKRKK